MSWWDSNQLTNFATKALKNAQKKIDKALDIGEDEANGSSNSTLSTSTVSSKKSDSSKPSEKGDSFWSTWGLPAGEDATTAETSTSYKLSSETSSDQPLDTQASQKVLTVGRTKLKRAGKVSEKSAKVTDQAVDKNTVVSQSSDISGGLSKESDENTGLHEVSERGVLSSHGKELEKESVQDESGWQDVDLFAEESTADQSVPESSAKIDPEAKNSPQVECELTVAEEAEKSPGPLKLGSKWKRKDQQKEVEVVSQAATEIASPPVGHVLVEPDLRELGLEHSLKTDSGPEMPLDPEETVDNVQPEICDLAQDSAGKDSADGNPASTALDIEDTGSGMDDAKQSAWGDDIRLSILAESSTSTESFPQTSTPEGGETVNTTHSTDESKVQGVVDDSESQESSQQIFPQSSSADVSETCEASRDPKDESSFGDQVSDNSAGQVPEPLSEAQPEVGEPQAEHGSDSAKSTEKDYTKELHIDTGYSENTPHSEAEELQSTEESSKAVNVSVNSEEDWIRSSLTSEEMVETSDELSESNKTLTSSESNRTLEGDQCPLGEDEENIGMAGNMSTSREPDQASSCSGQGLSSSSYVKNMLEEAMTESLRDTDSHTDSHSHSSNDMVRVESGHTSGHTSADEIDTTTSSDIEIISHISTPTPNGDYGPVNRPFDLSPLRHALSRSVRRGSPPGHKRSDSSSSGTSYRSHTGDELVSPDSSNSSGDRPEELKEDKEREADADAGGNPLETEKLLKKLAEMAEVLEARECKLVELSRENINLVEANSILRNQLQQAEEAREAEQTDVNAVMDEFAKRISDAEKRNNQILKEKDQLKKKLQQAEAEIIKKSDNTATQRLIAEKDQQISELLEEGEKLSKQQLQSNNIIKKLRAKEKENENLLKSNNKKVEDQKAEIEKLKTVLDNKIDNDKKQSESINQLNAAVGKQESEISRLKSELEDYQEKNRSMQVALDNSYKEMAELHKAKAVHASETQAIALSAEMTAKEELRLVMERQQLQARQDQEALINQIEDLQLSLSRLEKEHGRREDVLRQEISDLQQRLAEADDRNQDLTSSVSAATRPLLRQIENIQSTYHAQTSSYERVEKSLTERLAEAQSQLAGAVEKERAASEALMDTSSRITALESQASTLRQEKSRLQAQLDMERTKAELLEEAKHNGTAQMEALRRGHEHELSELRKSKVLVENQLEMEKMKLDAEKKKLILAHEQLRDKESQLMQLQSRAVTPPAYSRDNSMSASVFATSGLESPINMSAMSLSTMSVSQSEDLMDSSMMHTSLGSTRLSLYDSLRQSGAASVVENLQSVLKQKDGEIAQLQRDITELERTREAMARELVDITNKNEALESKLSDYPELQANYKDLDSRYNAILQMYGEKVEEADELRMDLQDVKDMYKGQIEHLLKNMGH